MSNSGPPSIHPSLAALLIAVAALSFIFVVPQSEGQINLPGGIQIRVPDQRGRQTRPANRSTSDSNGSQSPLPSAADQEKLCPPLKAWIDVLTAERPGLSVVTSEFEPVAPLFADDVFLKQFGVSYRTMSEDQRKKFFSERSRTCINLRPPMREVQTFYALASAFDSATHPSPTKSSQVMSADLDRLDAARSSLAKDESFLQSATPSADIFEQASSLVERRKDELAKVWPSEKRQFQDAVDAALARSAGPTLQARVAGLVSAKPSPELLMQLQAAPQSFRTLFDKAGAEQKTAVETQLADRRMQVIADLLPSERAKADSFPATKEGLDEGAVWLTDFRTLYLTPPSPPAAELIETKYIERRHSILAKMVPRFQQTISTSTDAQAVPTMFDDVFQLPEDRQTAAYRTLAETREKRSHFLDQRNAARQSAAEQASRRPEAPTTKPSRSSGAATQSSGHDIALSGGPAASRQAVEQALYAEPEMRQVNGSRDVLQDQQNLPNNSIYKPTPLQGGVQYLQNQRAARELYWRLENRLQDQVYGCNFCALKQGELSMLFQVEGVEKQVSGAAVKAMDDGKSSPDAIRVVQALLGGGSDTPAEQNAFSNEEANPVLTHYLERCNSLTDHTQNKECTEREYIRFDRLALEHQNIWPRCFVAHDWVSDPSAREGYETCMKADPLQTECLTFDSPSQCASRVTSRNVNSVRSAALKPPQSSSNLPFTISIKAGTRLTFTVDSALMNRSGTHRVQLQFAAPLRATRLDDNSLFSTTSSIGADFDYKSQDGQPGIHFVDLRLSTGYYTLCILYDDAVDFDDVKLESQPGPVVLPEGATITFVMKAVRECSVKTRMSSDIQPR
jgi:hypothetical protein